MRLAQTQVWPLLRNFDAIAPATAASRSASSKTMKGALPPSSIEHFITWSAAWRSRMRPTSVEPVKVSLRTRWFSQNSLPMSDDRDEVTTDRMPLGSPARSPRTASASADSGVSAAGRATNPQPTASAGPHLRVIMALGKFQGVIDPTTPIGWRSTVRRLSAMWPGIVSP